MRLNNYDEFEQSGRNFEWLRQSVSGASDIDLYTERHGAFLWMEFKHWLDGVTVPLGQHIALTQLAKREQMTVWLIGDSGEEDTWYVMPFMGRTGRLIAPLMDRKGKAHYPPVLFARRTRDEVRAMAQEWWDNQ